MKILRAITTTTKILLWIIMVPLLLLGVVGRVLYAPWSQELLRQYIVATMDGDSLRVSIDKLSLKFPLELALEGVTLDMAGSPCIHADTLEANVEFMPLLKGRAVLKHAIVKGASMSMGAPDSAMYMTLRADTLALPGASVTLSDMGIDVPHGLIAGGDMTLDLNPVETPVDTTTTESSPMTVRLGELELSRLNFTMRMLPTIDTLRAEIPRATLRGGVIDLQAQTIDIASLAGSGLGVTYLVPDSATIAATPVIPPSESTSPPWTIGIDTIGFEDARALYTTTGYTPEPGLDFGYIAVDSLTLNVHEFYNRAERVDVPLNISGTERCGVRLDVDGTLAIDSTGMTLHDFKIATPFGTALDVNFFMGLGDLVGDPTTPLSLTLDGDLAIADAALMFPFAGPYFAALPRGSALYATADINGTSGDIGINDLALAMGGTFKLRASGRVYNAFSTDPLDMGGNISLDGALINLNPLKRAFLDKSTAEMINIPRTTLRGNVAINHGTYKGKLTGITDKGRINLIADWNSLLENYDVNLSTDEFPVNAFLPTMGIGAVTATLDAKGHGYDPMARSTDIDADIEIQKAVYDNYTYSAISGNVAVHDGHADIDLISDMNPARVALKAAGNLDGDTYVWDATMTDLHADLHELGFSPSTMTIDGAITANASYTPATQVIAAKVVLNTFTYVDSLGSFELKNVVARLNTTDSTTNASVYNRDLYAFLSSDASLDTIMARMTAVSEVIDSEMSSRVIDVERLQQALPPFVLDINAGADNVITDILAESQMAFNNMSLTASNDSSLSLEGSVYGFSSGKSLRLDTIGLDISQYGPRMIITGRVDNRPGSFDEWAHVRLNGYLADNRLGLQVAQRNIHDREGYNLGVAIQLADSTVSLSIDPTDPVIAYEDWTVNEDNYVKYNFVHPHVDANLHMQGAGSSLAIYTNHVEGRDGHAEGREDHQEELVVDIADINIADWVNINPFAPPMAGMLSANVKISQDGDDIVGDGKLSLTDLTYNRERVGTIDVGLDVSTDLNGRIRAEADIAIDNVRTITVAGALNDSTAGSPLALDFSMIHFPLTAVNPFLPQGVARLRGMLNGRMDITGQGADPTFNGWIQFDSTYVDMTMLGVVYPVSDVRIPMDNNVAVFKDFGISGVNKVPLSLNGTVDLHSLSNPRVDLKLTTEGFEICDTKKATDGAEIYGKGLIDVNASVVGDMNFMRVNADLTVLPGTNITYVMTDAENVIENRSQTEMVKFVNFTDTAAMAAADSIAESEMALVVNASLTIANGSTINVDLSTDGQNKVRIQPEGTINFIMMPFSDPRVTGRLTINSGFARYTPPFMSEKNFAFTPGSSIAFNGDMLDPILNIRAVDEIKANVTQTGQNSRLINFDVSLAVTGTLNNMNVVFDLSTDDDVTVANELRSMSAEQRANQAMNMLLYNIYSGPGTTANANLSGNALYSFLTSQLNSWAARTIKGVDLSFGVDQYDRTLNGSTSTTTSYSYQVSKSLFNDRFKIVVGGNYSTDANADDNFSQNLIKDISFEYFLNNARTMYLRLFRHTGYESILEGEITRTGVGFVYKRRLTSLRQLFSRMSRRPAAPAPAPTPTDSTDQQ